MENPRKKDFESFYHQHIDKVYRFVFFRVGANKELAEDLVSEIFLKALEHFAGYDEKISRSAWIMTIAKNHLANHWRDAKPVGRLPEDEDLSDDAFWLNSAKIAYEKGVIKAEVFHLLEHLNASDCEIVTFHYIFGYSYLEIAEMKGVTENAIKMASHRALKKMRKKV